MKISIAMATYNGRRYLREQLDSFLVQTRLPDQLVITDDCSTDGTLEIVERYARSAPFEVRWERNEKKLGYTGNFNKALMKTTGDLVFLSDQDDVWFPEKLERMTQYALQVPNALVVMNDAALTDAVLNDTGLTKLGQIDSAGMTESSFVMGCCAAVRRELLDLCLPIPAGYKGHDNWIVMMAEGLGRKHVVRDVMQWYRRHEENESQYIVNRTTKVTKAIMLKDALSRLIQHNGHQEVSNNSRDQLKMFLDGVRVAHERAMSPLADDLMNYLSFLEKRISILDERLAVRQLARWRRLPRVFSLLHKGAYGEFSGLKSALRDALFR